MKLIYGLILFASLSLPLAISLPSHAGYPKTKSDALNTRIDSCLSKYGCRVTSNAGVCRGNGERDGAGRSPTSCHLVCKALDIVSVQCSTGKSNHENLKLLRSCMSGLNYTACYDGEGPCNADHQDHLHIGLREFFGCRG